MDIKSILASATTMLFLSGCAGEHVQKNYLSIIDDVMQTCRPSEGQQVDFAKNPIVGLRDVINWQMHSTSYDKDLFLQQVKLKVGQDEGTFNAIKMGIECPLDDELKVVSKLRILKSSIESDLNKQKFITELDYLRFKFAQAPAGSKEEKELLDKLQMGMERLKGNGLGGGKKYLVRSISFNDEASVSAGIDDAMEVYNTRGVLGFGLQGFNDLFGDHQGIRRGETVVISALQHKWKSGALLSSAIQVAYFNEPTYLNLKAPKEGEEDKRKAMILHITLENDPLGELLFAYRYIREQLEGVPTSITNLSEEEKAFAKKYVVDFFKESGFHFEVVQYAAGEFGYSDLFAAIESYEELGFEIHMLTLDYMGKMSTRGCVDGPHGKNIQDLYQRLQNYMLRKKIALLTAHQMSTEAKALERNGEEILVKAVCELGYYAGCRTVDNEVDMEIYQHIVKIGGKSYMTWQRGKHRKPGSVTPDDMRFCVYLMQEMSVIPWDYQREPGFKRRLPGYGNNDVNVDMF